MINGTISIADYLHAQRLHRKSVARWSYFGGTVVAACGVVAFAAGSTSYGLIILCAGVGGLVGEFVHANFFLPRRVAKLHGQQKALAEKFTYSWDAENISAQSPAGSARRPWTHYAKIKEDDHIFLLYHSDNIFEMLPKSWFPNLVVMNEFRKLAFRSADT